MLRKLLISLISVFLLAACSTEHEIYAPSAGERNLLLVYLGGDNNLSSEATDKLIAMREGWGDARNGRVVAYLDQPRGAQLIEFVAKSAAHSQGLETVEVYGAENSASAEIFGRVIRDVKARYKAETYNLLVFSHASGWLPEGRLAKPVQPGDEALLASMPDTYGAPTRSVIVDGVREMEIADMASAIPDHAFDFIAFEACFSAGVEVAFELRNKCNHILGSSAEIVSPGFSPTYNPDVMYLTTNNPGEFLKAVFRGVFSYAAEDYRRSATFSMIRTAGLEPLAAFVREHCVPTGVDIDDVQHFDRQIGSGASLFFDFEDYYSRLLSTDQQRRQLAALVGGCIEWKAATPTFMPTYGGFTITRHSGLTCYIPQPGYPYLNVRYGQLLWSKNTLQP